MALNCSLCCPEHDCKRLNESEIGPSDTSSGVRVRGPEHGLKLLTLLS
jgi:hypothetical protein